MECIYFANAKAKVTIVCIDPLFWRACPAFAGWRVSAKEYLFFLNFVYSPVGDVSIYID